MSEKDSYVEDGSFNTEMKSIKDEAEEGLSVEKLSGNATKYAFWEGQLSAISSINYLCYGHVQEIEEALSNPPSDDSEYRNHTLEEMAEQINNNIAEDIECGASRKQLKDTIRYYSGEVGKLQVYQNSIRR